MTINTEYDNEFDMFDLTLHNEGVQLSKLVYSVHPDEPYTADKDKNDFVYIQLLITPEKHRNNGYSTTLIKELVNTFPDKTIIASENSNSVNILKKCGVKSIK